MLAFSIDYYGVLFRATQSVGLFCTYAELVSEGIFDQKTGYTDAELKSLGINKKVADVAELYVPAAGQTDHILINTSGKVIDNKGKSKDGNDYYYVVNGSKKVVAIYLEN